MVTFLSGGTGTPKLLQGAAAIAPPAQTTVVANTGDDVELGGLLVCPDLDTVLYLGGDVLDTDTWWGVREDTAESHERVVELSGAMGQEPGPRYLEPDKQVQGRNLARWRRFSAVGEFMHIGDRDRALHLTRTSLLDEGHSLTEVTGMLADALGVPWRTLPMSDDPVATIVHTPEGPMHFQEFWIVHEGNIPIERVDFRGADSATPTESVLESLTDPVVIGPSNPITSIGPFTSLEGIENALAETSVVAVSPFIEDEVFSGPAAELMRAAGYDPSTRGVANAYPFADAFVLDEADHTQLSRPVVRTDTRMEDRADAERVCRAVDTSLEAIV